MNEVIPPGITVLICTYNGATYLPITLKHLAAQQIRAGISWEIILVNNASTDQTAQVAQRLMTDLFTQVPFRIVDEARPGKDRAMDKGLGMARFRFVLVCDDDNWLGEGYLQRAYEIMTANPRIGMLGGRGIPAFGGEEPAWFKGVEHYYAVGAQNPRSGEVVTSKGFLWGAGAVINREAYVRLLDAGFQRNITHDRYPRFSRSEDVELCLALRLTGYQVWYDEQLVLHHYIDGKKLTWDYLLRLTRDGGLAGPLLRPYQEVARYGARLAGGNAWMRVLWQRNRRAGDLKNFFKVLLTGNSEGNLDYQRRLGACYYFLGLWRLRATYNALHGHVTALYRRLIQAREENPAGAEVLAPERVGSGGRP
jgi:glycosyltransferase involved in cell wall biosynthesis